MKNEKIKEILSAYRPGNDDPQEEPTRTALEQAARDKPLSDWLEEQERNDAAIREALRDQPVPEGLQERLLQMAPSQSNRIRFPSISPWVYAAAACLLIGITALSFRHTIIENQLLGYHPQLSVVEKQDTFRDAMALYVANTIIQLDFQSADLPSIQDWLSGTSTPVHNEIPANLDARETIGCKTFLWRGQEVTLICFDAPGGGIVHLFLLEKEGVDKNTWPSIDEHLKAFNRNTVGWDDDELVYLLVGSDPEVAVAPYVNLS